MWCPSLRRNIFDWEVGVMIRLLSMLEELKSDSSKRDSWEWVINSKDTFTSQSLYSVLVNHTRVFFPHKHIWILGIPSKVSFLWNMYLDKILTFDHLQSRDWNLANRYILCMKREESVSHLFMHCSMAYRIWGFFFFHLKISWSFPDCFQDFRMFISWLKIGWQRWLIIWRGAPILLCGTQC